MTPTRLLIVDDNDLNVVLVQAVLPTDEFTVEAAADAHQALLKVATFQPEAILMDIQLPGMDGLALTRVLKAAPETRHICVIAFTAFAMRGDEAKMRAAGCDGYLSKPIDVRAFAAQVRALISPAA